MFGLFAALICPSVSRASPTASSAPVNTIAPVMMRLSPAAPSRCAGLARAPRAVAARRRIHIAATDASSEPAPAPAPAPPPNALAHDANADADARFEVIGSPFSLLSVSLAASQQLFTRRGTLVGLSGNAEHAISSLSALAPLRRAPLGIPFLYQKVSSTSHVTVLISTKSPISSIVNVHLDGRQDWLIAQRQALLAWTGQTLSLKPQYNTKLGLANWGNTYVTGRGLLALVGSGQLYQVQLKPGETYIAHPSNVVAYTVSATPPLPFRFKSSRLAFQVPDLGFGTLFQRLRFFRVMSETPTWRALAKMMHTLKTWLRRSIWGDRLFLRFEGPTTMLIQSRASRISDVLTLKDVDEIASSPPGAVEDIVTRKIKDEIRQISMSNLGTPVTSADSDGAKVQYATVNQDKVEFSKPS